MPIIKREQNAAHKKFRDIVYICSGFLILAAAILYMPFPVISCWVMATGVVIFSVITVSNPYPGKSIRGKRLFMFRVLSCILMIIGTYFMFQRQNIWFLAMLIAAVFMIYSAFVLPK
jgi:hypothetical protein